MKQITITEKEAGSRLDRQLSRILRNAPKSFLYKMLRKKNITLNGKRAQGNELLREGDQIDLYFSEETFHKFGGTDLNLYNPKAAEEIGTDTVPELEAGVKPPKILYRDENIILFDKPAGMLSQKSKPSDISLVEYLNAYLISAGIRTKEEVQAIKPAFCNRLDRNTSGITAAGISLIGLQTLNRLVRERNIEKYYRCIVYGTVKEDGSLDGFLKKDTRTNTVVVSGTAGGDPDAKRIQTAYQVLASSNGISLLEVHLITGRSHQIRAQLSSIGFPVLGDPKYGNAAINMDYRVSKGITRQLLHAYRLEFPVVNGQLSYLSGRTFIAPMPEIFQEVLK